MALKRTVYAEVELHGCAGVEQLRIPRLKRSDV
jgi:hypothetical protein